MEELKDLLFVYEVEVLINKNEDEQEDNSGPFGG